MTRRRGTASPGTVVTMAANVPGAPTFVTNRQFDVTASNNALELTSYKAGELLGGPVTISIAADVYTPTAYASAWEDAINADDTLTNSGEFTVTVSYDSTTHKITIATSDADYTLALTGVGSTSTAAHRCGFYSNKEAAATLLSDTEAHGSGTITIDLDTNDNGANADYVIHNKTTDDYLDLDGAASEGEVWGTAAEWNNGGASGRVTAVELEGETSYTFDVKARDEAEDKTEYGAASAAMATMPDLDAGEYNENVDYETSSGNTKIEDLAAPSGNQAEDIHEGFYGDVTISYKLQSYSSLVNNSIEVQFSEDYDGEDPDSATWAAATMGTGGSGVSELTANANGISKTYKWDSVTDAGGSEYKEVGLRLRAKDSDGDAAEWEFTDLFWVNNRPGVIAWETTYPYDKDTTPEIRAVIPALRGGSTTKGYPSIEFRDRDTGAVIAAFYSFESINGWWYETDEEVWEALTFAGIPNSAVDGTNRIKFVVPDADALDVDEYSLNGRMYETRDRG